MAPLSTHIAYPVPSPSFVYIHCIWVSPWTHLSFSSIEHISSLFSFIPSFCSLCYLPPSSLIQSFPSRLHISLWTYCIPSQHPFFHSALPLISLQPHCSFLPLSDSGQWLFCFCQLPPNTPIQFSFKFFDEGSSLIAAPSGDLFEFLHILVTDPPSLLDCSQLFYFSLFFRCFPKVVPYFCKQLLCQFHF